VTAFSAPNILNRCLPDGDLIKGRVKHQTNPKKAPNTKCAASTKNTVLWPDKASWSLGSSFFF